MGNKGREKENKEDEWPYYVGWARYGIYLSLIAGVYQIFFALYLCRFISLYSIALRMSALVLLCAFLIIFPWRWSKLLGGALVICFSVLWWYTCMGGWGLPVSRVLPTFIDELLSPFCFMSCVGLALGIAGGALGIAEVVRSVLKREK